MWKILCALYRSHVQLPAKKTLIEPNIAARVCTCCFRSLFLEVYFFLILSLQWILWSCWSTKFSPKKCQHRKVQGAYQGGPIVCVLCCILSIHLNDIHSSLCGNVVRDKKKTCREVVKKLFGLTLEYKWLYIKSHNLLVNILRRYRKTNLSISLTSLSLSQQQASSRKSCVWITCIHI